MATLRPSCRARHLKQLLASVDRVPGPAAAHVREALGPEHVREIEDGTGLEWLPIDVNIEMTRALHEALGEAEFERFHRVHFAEVIRGPVYGAVVRGAAALFGPDPTRWMRLLPDSWTLTFRDCGVWSVEHTGLRSVALALRELPEPCVADRIWSLAIAACVSATFDFAGSEGAVALDSVDADAREARFEMRWTPGSVRAERGGA